MVIAQTFKPNDLHFKMIGRELWNRLPTKALQYLKPYISSIPYDTDFSRIQTFYLSAFSSIYGIEKEEIVGAVYKSSKVDIRKYFISCMVHIYCPHVYYQHANEINLSKKGFVMWLSKALQIPESNTSGSIREVLAWERDYEEFRTKVGAIVEKLKNIA